VNPSDENDRKQTTSADVRKARLAARLRANLQQRKMQARSRRDGEADSRPEGLLEGEGKRQGGGD